MRDKTHQKAVVICWKISIFAPAKTTLFGQGCLECALWFAEKLVSLHQQKQLSITEELRLKGCDLLKN